MEGERVKGLCVVVLALVIGLAGCGSELNNENRTEKQSAALRERAETMKIRVTNEEYEIVYQLNDSTAAKGLYEQLPLTLEVKDFSTNEKTFYPPKELDVTDTPVAVSYTHLKDGVEYSQYGVFAGSLVCSGICEAGRGTI